MERTPPWPETEVDLGQDQEDHGTTSLKFSPCGSFLVASGAYSDDPDDPSLVSICDRRGKITHLAGHESSVVLLSFSKDGKYLASAGADNSIRIWPTNRTTGLPQQSDKTLLGHRGPIACLDFAPDDSNILVCGDSYDIKVWDVETEVCTHQIEFNGSCWPGWYIQSMYLPPAKDKVHTCIFVISNGALIRTRWDPQSDGITSDIGSMSGLRQVETSVFSHCGSLLAASSRDSSGAGVGSIHLTLFDMKTLKVVQTIALDDCTRGPNLNLVFSSDGKTLVFDVGRSTEIMVFQVHDLNIRRRLGENDAAADRLTTAFAYDSTNKVVASVGHSAGCNGSCCSVTFDFFGLFKSCRHGCIIKYFH